MVQCHFLNTAPNPLKFMCLYLCAYDEPSLDNKTRDLITIALAEDVSLHDVRIERARQWPLRGHINRQARTAC